MMGIGLGLAFILELVAFIAFADLGLMLPVTLPLRIVVFVVLLATIIVFWSLFMAPKAPYRFSGLRYTMVKSVIYLVAAVVITIEYSPFSGMLFAVGVLWSEAALRSAGMTPTKASKTKTSKPNGLR